MSEEMVIPQSWHLSKNIPIGLIVLMVGQVFGMGYIAATTKSQISNNAQNIVGIAKAVEEVNAKADRADEQLRQRGLVLLSLDLRYENLDEGQADLLNLVRKIDERLDEVARKEETQETVK